MYKMLYKICFVICGHREVVGGHMGSLNMIKHDLILILQIWDGGEEGTRGGGQNVFLRL